MTTFIRNAAILGGLLLATASFAQDKATSPQKSATTQSAKKEVQDRQKLQDAAPIVLSADYMTRELGLNSEQSEKLKSIEEEMNKQGVELQKLDPKEREGKQERLMIEQNKMIASVLTPEQNKKMAEMKAQIRKQNVKTNAPIK